MTWKHWRRKHGVWRLGHRNAGQPQDNRGTTLLIERGNHRTTMGQDPASASSAGEAKEGYMANHSRGSDQPPHRQLTSWFLVQPERLQATKKPTQQSYFHKLACSRSTRRQPWVQDRYRTTAGQPQPLPRLARDAPETLPVSNSV